MDAGATSQGIALEGVTKRFGSTLAVAAVDLAVACGEFFAVLGPSGCGKSTLLRLIAGLEALDGGTIRLGGRTVAGRGVHVPPEARGVAVVFQSYALWPHMTVFDNVAFPARARALGKPDVARIAQRAIDAVSLTPLSGRKPAALSGGQQQRVALARCLASEADILLMDEPLANLDPHLRAAMERELSAVHREASATTLYITHDQREAMALADRIAVMQAGRILQVDAPQSLYDRPVSSAVAQFIGRGTLIEADARPIAAGRAAVTIDREVVEVDAAGEVAGPCRVLVRPHQVRLGEGPFEGEVGAASYRGGTFDLRLRSASLPAIAAEARVRPAAGSVRFAITGGWILPQDD